MEIEYLGTLANTYEGNITRNITYWVHEKTEPPRIANISYFIKTNEKTGEVLNEGYACFTCQKANACKHIDFVKIKKTQ